MITRFSKEHEFLSNFYPSTVKIGQIKFSTIEHGYQASKVDVKTIEGLEFFNHIQYAKTPGRAKRLGRRAPLRSDWEQIKIPIMLYLVRQKFSQPGFKDLLLNTKNAKLLESNISHDNYWGSCNCRRSQCKNPGKNMLGKILMTTRDILYELQNHESSRIY